MVIGAVVMVTLPLIVGVGLISMLVINRNSQTDALPTLVNTQAPVPTVAEALVSFTPTVEAPIAPAASPAVSTTSTPANLATEIALSTATLPPPASATLAPTSTGGNAATATPTTTPPTTNSGGTVTPSATATANITPTPTLNAATVTPTATATSTPPGAGIVVGSTSWYFDSELNLVQVVGEVTNNTDVQQLIESVDGVFYSAPGVVISEANITGFYPQEVIPVGGTVPFYFELEGVTSLHSSTVTVTTDISPFVTRTDLVLQEPSEQINSDGYRCFEGRVRNNGERLQNELVIIASVYDEQNKLVNFEYQAFSGGAAFEVLGDRTRSYSVCVRPPHTGRADVRVYGR